MPEETPWHSLSIAETFERRESEQAGFAATEASRRLEQHGPNEVDQEAGVSPWQVLLDQVLNPIVAVGSTVLIAGELRKVVARRRERLSLPSQPAQHVG